MNLHFSEEITKNQSKTKSNIKNVRKRFHSVSAFIDDKNLSKSKKILNEKDIIANAIENKGKAEKKYWNNQQTDEESEKLLNSSLQIYIHHRSKVLEKFHKLIQKFDDEGVNKSELEDSIHDLFLKRGENLRTSETINHLHNLWILDDKYTVFSESFKSKSTKNGQELSDIYMWIDDPEHIKELLILELKSTTKSHNAGNKYESMIAQVKRYASNFYKNPVKTLNWDIDPNEILYSGIILARKSDIHKELNSNNIGGIPHKIPFLKSSYFFNEQFSIGMSKLSTPKYIDIRIEMYSYEDIYELSKNRNTVFFKLLNGEYEIEENT